MNKFSSEASFSKVVVQSLTNTFKDNARFRVTNPEMVVNSKGQAYRSAQNKGRPDLIGHLYGIHTEIELKAGSSVSPEQVRELAAINKGGGLGLIMFAYHDGVYVTDEIETFSVRNRERYQKLFVHDYPFVSIDVGPLKFYVIQRLLKINMKLGVGL